MTLSTINLIASIVVSSTSLASSMAGLPIPCPAIAIPEESYQRELMKSPIYLQVAQGRGAALVSMTTPERSCLTRVLRLAFTGGEEATFQVVIGLAGQPSIVTRIN